MTEPKTFFRILALGKGASKRMIKSYKGLSMDDYFMNPEASRIRHHFHRVSFTNEIEGGVADALVEFTNSRSIWRL